MQFRELLLIFQLFILSVKLLKISKLNQGCERGDRFASLQPLNVHDRIRRQTNGFMSMREDSISLKTIYLDLSHRFSVISIKGNNAAQFVNSLGTNYVEDIPNKAIKTCFLSSKGKLLAFTLCVTGMNEVRVLYESNRWFTDFAVPDPLLTHLMKHVFPLDKITIGLEDVRVLISLNESHSRIGDDCGAISSTERGFIVANAAGYITPIAVKSSVVLVSRGADSSINDLVVETDQAAADSIWENHCINIGRFSPSHHNASLSPLDLGLVPSVHFLKGCYTGQEIIVKTATNIRRQLCKVEFMKESDAALDSIKCGMAVVRPESEGTRHTNALNGAVNGVADSIGQIIQVCASPRADTILALALCQRGAVSLSEAIRIVGSNGCLAGRVVEVSLPFPSYDLNSAAAPPVVKASVLSVPDRSKAENDRRKEDKLRQAELKLKALKEKRSLQ